MNNQILRVQQRKTQSNTADVTDVKLNESLQSFTDFSGGLLQLKTADFRAAYLKMMKHVEKRKITVMITIFLLLLSHNLKLLR